MLSWIPSLVSERYQLAGLSMANLSLAGSSMRRLQELRRRRYAQPAGCLACLPPECRSAGLRQSAQIYVDDTPTEVNRCASYVLLNPRE